MPWTIFRFNLYNQAIGWLTGSPTWAHNRIAFWKIRNLSFCRKIFEHCHFAQNFILVDKMLSKNNPTLLLKASHVFSNGLRKYAIWFCFLLGLFPKLVGWVMSSGDMNPIKFLTPFLTFYVEMHFSPCKLLMHTFRK